MFTVITKEIDIATVKSLMAVDRSSFMATLREIGVGTPTIETGYGPLMNMVMIKPVRHELNQSRIERKQKKALEM